MKVFISSVVTGFEPFREAASLAAETLRHNVIRAEDFGAAAESPQEVCLGGVRSADVVLLLLGGRYGEIQERSGLSATHEEFREATQRAAVLVFVQEGVTREARQREFLDEVRDWSSGHFTARFSTSEQLQRAVVAALHDLEMSRRGGGDDEQELIDRIQSLMPRHEAFSSASLCLILAAAPRQQVIRPRDIEEPGFANAIIQEAMFGSHAVFSTNSGSRQRLDGNRLIIEQADASILVDELGSVRIVQPARDADADERSYLPVLIEEEILARIRRGLDFSSWLLGRVDPTGRLSRVAPAVGLMHASYAGWRTREQHRRQPNTIQMAARSSDDALVMLSPAVQPRAALRSYTAKLAEDFMVLLRRQRRS